MGFGSGKELYNFGWMLGLQYHVRRERATSARAAFL